MAVFNLDYYCGKDLYSDGSVEDLIFNIVKKGWDHTDFADRDDYYAIMYHLSLERENILNWYPFYGSDCILEVGSGCGAVTGLLCEKAGWVTSVELSKKRAEINYARHKNKENLEIIVGNLNEVALDRHYDYVLLNGVFEYAAGYTHSAHPYEDFLCSIKKYVKSDGKILIAIENRLGIKYFSGAAEDHTGVYYAGLNQYKNSAGVQTFSKAEIEDIFCRCGFKRWRFYYPYPDYKFPSEIFTDENVNSENYGRVYRNYQKGKLELFSELEMVAALKREGAMGSFSNSFFVELSAGNAKPSGIVYAKLNNTRKKEYRTATIVRKKQGKYTVEKSALNKEAVKHLEKIYGNQEKGLPAGFHYLKGRLHGNRIKYPYITVKNLDSLFMQWMLEGNREKIKRHTDRIYSSLMESAGFVENFYGAEFQACFGRQQCSSQMQCVQGGNIDMIFENIFWTGEGYIVIDPEWVFDFFVPAPFIIWRMLHAWYSKYKLADEVLARRLLYGEYGITEEMENTFQQWDAYFAANFVSDMDLNHGVQQVYAVDIDCALREQVRRDKMHPVLYIDHGQGFSEDNKCGKTVSLKDGRFQADFALRHKEKIFGLRLDPADGKFCRCFVETCCVDGQPALVCPVNADSEDDTVFLNTDPQFIIEIEPGSHSRVVFSGEFQYLEEYRIEQEIYKITEKSALAKAEKNILEDKIQCMEAEKEVLNGKIQSLDNRMQMLHGRCRSAETELELVKNSRGWKLLCFLRKMAGRG